MDSTSPKVTVLGAEFDFNELASTWFDPDIREAIHADLSPCTPQAFTDEYCKRHILAFGETFDPREDWQE
jgi:hypothetical protein